MDMHSTIIGTPVSQIVGPDKVTGRTRFAADVEVPGMLWGKMLRSPHPHARIRRMDASAAWRVPGVKAVVTGQDAPGHYMGKVLRDMPVLCWDRGRRQPLPALTRAKRSGSRALSSRIRETARRSFDRSSSTETRAM